jgi:hypothetical protein
LQAIIWQENNVMAKHNWKALKGEYVRGDIESVKEFLRTKKISYSGNTTKRIGGWPKAREEYLNKLEDTTVDKVIEKVSETEAQVRARHARASKFLQGKALKALQKQVPETAMESVRMLQVGIDGERDALDMNKQSIVAGNINVAILNTRYGKKLQQMTYEEIQGVLKRLGELDAKRRKGTRDSGSIRTDVEEGEVVQG